METKEYRTFDKSAWPRGPWDDEPDKKQWQDGVTGLPCLIVRNRVGALCGYVGVPKSHPAHGMDYGVSMYDSEGNERAMSPAEQALYDVQVHGGLTFSSSCANDSSRESWETLKTALDERRLEAARFPHGDAARYIRDWESCLNDYDAYVRLNEARNICHVPGEGEAEHAWWFGFDCIHSGDYAPEMRGNPHESYRDFAYVTAEVESLARQLAAFPQLATSS